MKPTWNNLRLPSIVVAAVLTVGAVTAGLPQGVSEARLGPGWQCSRTAFLITTCSPVHAQKPLARDQAASWGHIGVLRGTLSDIAPPMNSGGLFSSSVSAKF